LTVKDTRSKTCTAFERSRNDVFPINGQTIEREPATRNPLTAAPALVVQFFDPVGGRTCHGERLYRLSFAARGRPIGAE
jgi:hypothetical protein